VTALTLRRGGDDDRDFVLDLGKRTSGVSVSPLRPAPVPLVEESYENLVDFSLRHAHTLIVAEDALEGALGFLILIEDIPDEVTGLQQAFVAYMAVEPHARRRGIGARLLGAAEEAARASGLSHLALMVTEDNAPARELYAQAGYSTERRLLCKPL
jgi:ribosomal protein S18 acetylase RimI-like enzyme